jgi:putative ABC transport system permease protein
MRGFSASSDPANRIYTSYNALKAITTESKANATTATDSKTGRESSTALREQVSGTYTFQDVDHYESFQKDVTAMGLSDDYTVSSSDLTSYEASLVPLKNLSTFAGYFLLVVLLIGGIILIVFNIFNIRERKYEIGVLTAIGMKKGKVAVQFVCELFVVTFIAIFIGTGVGAVISVPVANTLLASQIASQQEQQSEKMANFGGKFGNQTTDAAPAAANAPSGAGMRIPGMSSVTDYVSDISATIDILVILQLMAIGVLLTIVSSCAAVTSVLRYEPLKILTNRA